MLHAREGPQKPWLLRGMQIAVLLAVLRAVARVASNWKMLWALGASGNEKLPF